MRYLLPKSELQSDAPGWFIAEYASDNVFRGRRELMFRCPKCLCLGALGLHSVDQNGEVNASVLHQRPSAGVETCGWHEWVTLEGWPPSLHKAAGERFITETPN
jgi:hypothetical protein